MGWGGERGRSDFTHIHACMQRTHACVRACACGVCVYTMHIHVRMNLCAFVYLNIRAYIFKYTHVYAGVYKYAHTYEDVSRAHTRVRRQWSGRAGIGWRSRLGASKYGTVSAVHS